MPYTKDTLPANVKSLPSHLQDVWMDTFNSAWKTYKGDEQTCFKVAWAAVNKARGRTAQNSMNNRTAVTFTAAMEPKIDGGETYALIEIFGTDPTKREMFDFHDGPIRLTPNALKLMAETGMKSVLRGPKGPLDLGHELNYNVGVPKEVFLTNDALSIMYQITDAEGAQKIRSGQWKNVSGKIFFDNNSIVIDGAGCAVINEAWLDTTDFVDNGAFPCAAVTRVCDRPEQCRLMPALFQAIYPSHPEGRSPDGMTDVATSTLIGPQVAEKNHTPMELAQEKCRQEAFGLREKYSINAENSKKSQFLYTPTDNFSDWKFPVRDNGGKLQQDLVEAAITRLHMTTPAIQAVVRPKLKSLAKSLGIDAKSLGASLENKEETKMTEELMAELAKQKEIIAISEKAIGELKASAAASEKKYADLEAKNKKLAEDIHAVREQGSIGLQMRHDMLFNEKQKLTEKLDETCRRAQKIELSYRQHLAGELFEKRLIAGIEDSKMRDVKIEEFTKLPYVDFDALMKDADKTIMVFRENGILGDTYGTGAAVPAKQVKPAFTIGNLVAEKK